MLKYKPVLIHSPHMYMHTYMLCLYIYIYIHNHIDMFAPTHICIIASKYVHLGAEKLMLIIEFVLLYSNSQNAFSTAIVFCNLTNNICCHQKSLSVSLENYVLWVSIAKVFFFLNKLLRLSISLMLYINFSFSFFLQISQTRNSSGYFCKF